jgi:hypothetical protein
MTIKVKRMSRTLIANNPCSGKPCLIIAGRRRYPLNVRTPKYLISDEVSCFVLYSHCFLPSAHPRALILPLHEVLERCSLLGMSEVAGLLGFEHFAYFNLLKFFNHLVRTGFPETLQSSRERHSSVMKSIPTLEIAALDTIEERLRIIEQERKQYVSETSEKTEKISNLSK